MKYKMTVCMDVKVSETIADRRVAIIEEKYGFTIGSKEHIKFVEKQVKRCIDQCFEYNNDRPIVKVFDFEIIK